MRPLLLHGPAEPGAWATRCALGLILLLSLGLGLWHAGTKPFWFDEILTIEVSRLPSSEARWQALYDGCDGMPPGYYWISAMAARLPLDDHTRWRVPSLLGWLLALGGIHLFVASVCGRGAGLAAVLLLALTPVSSYAWETRPYALLLGVLGWAAVSWQRAGRHWGWIAALAVLLTAATNLHYLAPLSVLCFALAETAVTLAQRQIRWRIWAAFAVAAIPTLAALPLLIKMKADFGARFWARPELGGLPYYYGNLLGFPLAVALALLPFGFVYLLRAILLEKPANGRWQALQLALSLLLLPLLSLLFALATHGGFNERYAMPVVLGYAAAIPLLLAWNPGGVARGFTLSLLLAFLILTAREAAGLRTQPSAQRAGQSGAALTALRSTSDPSLVVANPLEFLSAWYYARPDERARLFYIGEPEAAYRLGGTDGAVRLLLALRRMNAAPVRTFEEFLTNRQDFLLLTAGPAFLNWQAPRLKELGWRLDPLGTVAGGQLYRASAPRPGS
ncbi:MAG: hypothetical protein J0H49_23820 [Acidobacteria bacterium]|nr:hypothetical protein [Acidobacteriota bacterium]